MPLPEVTASLTAEPPLVVERRLAIARYFGSRSLRSTSSGVATHSEEYVPTIMPTNRASDRSFSVPAPNSVVPMNRIAATGRIATSEVFSDRISVWFSALLAACV